MSARNGWLAAFQRLSVKPTGASKINLLGHPSADADPPKPIGRPRSLIPAKVRQAAYNAKRSARRKAAKSVMPSEHAEQVAVIQWWTLYAAAHKLDVRLLMAIPNAQKFMSLARNMHAALATIRAEGFRDAAPDLLLAIPRRMVHQMADGSHRHIETTYCGLFCEMKRLDGKLSAEQHSFGMLLQSQGYAWVMAKGAGEAIRAIEGYLGTAKAAGHEPD